MRADSPTDPEALALAALAATLSDDRGAHRLLDLTGIGTDDLRERATDPELLAAVVRFLEAHEPDLLAVAEALGVAPGQIVQARQLIEEGLR